MNDFSSDVRRITSVDFEEYNSYSEEETDELYAPEGELDDDDPDKIMCRWEFFKFVTFDLKTLNSGIFKI